MAFRPASKMDVKSGDAGDDWSAAILLDFATRLLLLECWDNALLVVISYDGITFQDEFEVDPDRPLVIPFQAQAVKVKNKEATKTSRYQVGGLD